MPLCTATSRPVSCNRTGRLLAVAIGCLLVWTLVPAASLVPYLGAAVCTMGCAGTPGCCCRPTAPSDRDRSDDASVPELSAREDPCPPGCAMFFSGGNDRARSESCSTRPAAPSTDGRRAAVVYGSTSLEQIRNSVLRRGPPREADEFRRPSPSHHSPRSISARGRAAQEGCRSDVAITKSVHLSNIFFPLNQASGSASATEVRPRRTPHLRGDP
jgi:hypothetical protein